MSYLLNTIDDEILRSIVDPAAEQTYPSIPLHPGVARAFEELQHYGYITRANFWCCQGCGWAGLPEGSSKQVVFYHDQDARRMVEDGCLALAWSGDGGLICTVLNKHGVITGWDGTEDKRIFCQVGTLWLNGFTIDDEEDDQWGDDWDDEDDEDYDYRVNA